MWALLCILVLQECPTQRHRPHGGKWARVRYFYPNVMYLVVAGMPHAALPPSWQRVGVVAFFPPTLYILLLQECPTRRHRPHGGKWAISLLFPQCIYLVIAGMPHAALLPSWRRVRYFFPNVINLVISGMPHAALPPSRRQVGEVATFPPLLFILLWRQVTDVAFFPQHYLSCCCRNAPRGATALMAASSLFFPQHYTSCCCRNAPRGATALMAASRRGHSRVVELLLQVSPLIQTRSLLIESGSVPELFFESGSGSRQRLLMTENRKLL
jgi:hypothetical protein